MENNNYDIEWIERYVDRRMTPAELAAMEEMLSKDPLLRERCNEHRKLVKGIRLAHLHDRLEQLRILEEGLPSVTQPEGAGNQRFLQSWWKPLAAAAALIVAAGWYFLSGVQTNPEELFAKNFQPYVNAFEPTVRGSEQGDDLRRRAFRAYDQQDYVQAAELFTQLNKQKAEAPVLLLLGCSNLATGHTAEAQDNFLTLIKDFDELDGQAKWYLALCYLRQGESDKARMVLEELQGPEVTYSKRAHELLKKVR